MQFSEILVLIPAHSLEDFPSELGEGPAESLLNAFAVAWSPRLLAVSQTIPKPRRADIPVPQEPGRVVFVPQPAADWGPGALDDVRRAGAIVIEQCVSRGDYEQSLAAALTAAGVPELPDPPSERTTADFTADCRALGVTWLMSELLTRCMRNFAQVDAVRLELDALAAARAIAAGDAPTAEERLRRAFETLLECRERFYPVDCYLLDLCLLIPRQAGAPLERLVEEGTPVNFLATAADWLEILQSQPALRERLTAGWNEGRLDLIGGEYAETASAPLDVQHVIAQLQRGRETWLSLFGRTPSTWGRRKFGLSPLTPQLLSRFEFTAGLHVLIDDGQYPDEEHARFRWQGCDGTAINALSRIPLAADSASSFLRFPQRLAESMDHDSVVGLVLARWPELRSPFWNDIRRGQRYAPVLGRVATFQKFFSANDYASRLTEFKASQYFSPTLVQSVARQTDNPLSRYVDAHRRQLQADAVQWCADIAAFLSCGRLESAPGARLADGLCVAEPESAAPVREAFDARLEAFGRQAVASLARQLLPAPGTTPGRLVFNPWSFSRRATVARGDENQLGRRPGAAAAEDANAGEAEAPRQPTAVVELPPCGFAWVSESAFGTPGKAMSGLPLAEPLVVRNELFEVRLSEVTGGIAQIRTYRRSPNRLSQQVAYRFPRERKFTVGEGDSQEQQTSFYTDMRMTESRVVSAGPDYGAVETFGVCVDPQTEEELAEFQQRLRLRPGRAVIELELELSPRRLPEGDPWTNYFGVRWAWKNEEAALTRSLHQTAQPVDDAPRLEAPYFIEIADGEFRTTILPCGLPYHRRIGPRMLDTLLMTAGETQRRFQLAIAVDAPFPLEAALDAMAPPLVSSRLLGPPASPSGWLLQVSVRNVVLLGLQPLPAEAGAAAGAGAGTGTAVATGAGGSQESAAARTGLVARLLETDGRRRTFDLSCFRTPRAARQIDFTGRTIQEFRIAGDAVRVEIAPFELCDVELLF